MKRENLVLSFLVILAAYVAPVRAGNVELTFSPPTNPVPKPITIHFDLPGGGVANVPVMIPPGTTVMQKRNLVVGALNAAGFPANAEPEPNKCTITGVPAGASVRVIDGGTGEIQDGVAAPHGQTGGIMFPGFFPPNTYQNQPATFTAGIVTDLGELTVQVTASELNFQTDGPIICQALFQRLAPRAPQYGAQINYAGDRLEVYFDPAYTVTIGGVSGGTTSQGQGAQSYLIIPPIQIPIPGDMNCDGALNGLDVGPFILAVTNPNQFFHDYPGCEILAGDMNNDGVVDDHDINPFVQALTANH